MNITNGIITVGADAHGAELCSIVKDGREYVWQADKEYWARHAPILFPVVGKVWNDMYRVDGQIYNLPHKFHLEARYTLEGATVHIVWKVVNTDSKPIYCSIGAHPAFNYPEFCKEDSIHAYAELFDGKDNKLTDLKISVLGAKGCCTEGKKPFHIEGGQLELKADTFDADAIIQEDRLVKRVTLLDKQKKPYLSLYSKCSEVMAIWSPVKKDAPFVCLEPWLGRADKVEYTDEYSKKDWIHKLAVGESLEFDYSITV